MVNREAGAKMLKILEKSYFLFFVLDVFASQHLTDKTGSSRTSLISPKEGYLNGANKVEMCRAYGLITYVMF